MKLIFVGGLSEIDMKTIIDLAIQRTTRRRRFKAIDIDSVSNISEEIRDTASPDEARSLMEQFHSEVESTVVAGMKEQRDGMIVSSPLTLDTEYGYMRSLPQDFFETFKPDNFIVIEKEMGNLEPKTAEQQMVNRYYAARYAFECGSFLKIIRFREDRTLGAVEQLSEILKN